MRRAILFAGLLGLIFPLPTRCFRLFQSVSGQVWAQEIALTSDGYTHKFPEWSPDGNWIVCQKRDATGYAQIYKVSSDVGIEEEESSAKAGDRLEVYPNPFSTRTEISMQYAVGSKQEQLLTPYSLLPTISIYDLSGRMVKSFPLTTDHYSLTTDFSPGIYFLKVANPEASGIANYKPVKIVKLK